MLLGPPRSTSLPKRSFRSLILIISLTIFGLSVGERSEAIPRFSLLTGTRCSVCHFDPQGSGLRTELGWEMMNKTGALQWGGVDTSSVSPTNALYNGMLYPGADARFQLV